MRRNRKSVNPPPKAAGDLQRMSDLLQAELSVELVNATAGVDQLLLAGVEGMALGADLNGDVLLGRASLYHFAAGAADGGLEILGMDAFLHNLSPRNMLP